MLRVRHGAMRKSWRGHSRVGGKGKVRNERVVLGPHAGLEERLAALERMGAGSSCG